MKKIVSVLTLAILMLSIGLQSCSNKPNAQDLKTLIQQKAFAALKCDSNSDIISVNISNVSENQTIENSYNFVGKYVGKLVMKYEGDINGSAIFVDDKIVIQSIHYETSILSGEISSACLDNE